jgi:hypothetical protein
MGGPKGEREPTEGVSKGCIPRRGGGGRMRSARRRHFSAKPGGGVPSVATSSRPRGGQEHAIRHASVRTTPLSPPFILKDEGAYYISYNKAKGVPTEGGFKKWSAALSMGGGAGGASKHFSASSSGRRHRSSTPKKRRAHFSRRARQGSTHPSARRRKAA